MTREATEGTMNKILARLRIQLFFAFCLCSRLNNVGATNQGLRASKWCGKNVFFSPRSRHPVDDDLLQLRQLRRPLVQRRVASRALGGFVKFEDPVHLEIVAKFKGRWFGSNGPRINV